VAYIFISMVLFTAVIMAGTIASRSLNAYIAVLIENLVSIVIPLVLAIPFIGKVSIHNQKVGLLAAIVVGILIALYPIALTKSYAVNKVGIVAPIVFGGGIFLSAILSYFLLREKISLFQGIGLGLLGIALIIITYARITGR